MNLPNYALFIFDDGGAAGGWNDFHAIFDTMKEAIETGQVLCTGHNTLAQIVHLAERRVLVEGEMTYVPSTLTGGPTHPYFKWSEPQQP